MGELDHSVAAVVLNWRDTPRTMACISNLLDESAIDRIWVVDNESDGSLQSAVELFASSRVTVLAQKSNLGFSAGMNIGICAALADGGAAVLAQNNDALFRPGGVELLRSALFADEQLAAVAPLVVDPDGCLLSVGGTFRAILMETRDDSSSEAPDFLTWASILVKAETFREVGLLSEDFFMYWEDVDFGRRCVAAGRRLAVVRQAVVEHEVSSSHRSAGHKIETFSALGLVVLARRVGGLALVGLVVRAIARLLKQMGRRDINGVRAVLIGLWLGFKVSPRQPAFGLLRERGLVNGVARIERGDLLELSNMEI